MVKIITPITTSSGKSTLAKKISRYYNCPHLNSGRLYRAVAWKINDKKVKINDKKKITTIAKSLTSEDLNSKNLFSSEIDKISSIISKKSYLRDMLMSYQRDFPKRYAKDKEFVVIEGRDIGTKFFLCKN